MLPALHNDNAYFHRNRKSRFSNPTFISSFMTDSLTTLTPQPFYKKAYKETQYKQNFELPNDQNKISIHNAAKSSNYAKFSRQSFQKSRSSMSNYGANILSQSNKAQF